MDTDKSREGVLAVIIQHLEETLDEPPEAPLTADTRIAEDLALDSLQSFEMIAALEDHYHITITVDTVQHVKSLGDVAEVVSDLAR